MLVQSALEEVSVERGVLFLLAALGTLVSITHFRFETKPVSRSTS